MTASAEARDTALLAAQAAADKLATDVSIVDVSDRLAITDAFVLASAPNERQVQSIVDEVEERLREHGIKPVRREGVAESRWVLLDFVDVVVHVQHAEERAYYALERLWKDCPTIPFVDSARRGAGGGRHGDAGRTAPRRPTRRRPAGDRPSACPRCAVPRLVLWRHGRTEWNATGRFQGQLDPPLDEEGRRQAVLAAAAPRRRRPAAGGHGRGRPATSSRAAETAAALTELLGVPLRLDAAAARARDGLVGGPDPRRGRRAVSPSSTRTGWPAGRCAGRGGEEPAAVAERALAALVDLPPAAGRGRRHPRRHRAGG